MERSRASPDHRDVTGRSFRWQCWIEHEAILGTDRLPRRCGKNPSRSREQRGPWSAAELTTLTHAFGISGAGRPRRTVSAEKPGRDTATTR